MALIEYTVAEGQSVYDVALMKYGTLNELFQLFVDNPTININSDLTAGTVLLIDDTIVGEENIKSKYLLSNFVTNNADNNFVAQVLQKQFMNGDPFDFQNGDPFEYN